jgi:hypothetical protein
LFTSPPPLLRALEFLYFSLCSEDVLSGELLIGDFTVSPPDGRVSVTVSDGSSNVVYSKSVQSEGKFAHTANKPGEYRMCFHNSEGVSQKTVGLMLSSGGRDYKEMAKSAIHIRAHRFVDGPDRCSSRPSVSKCNRLEHSSDLLPWG